MVGGEKRPRGAKSLRIQCEWTRPLKGRSSTGARLIEAPQILKQCDFEWRRAIADEDASQTRPSVASLSQGRLRGGARRAWVFARQNASRSG